jgi:malonyl-CoA reductase/3-hydroxypropionate dehydrogenase (NADP+)
VQLVENLARFVVPEIQINAIAPGPVEGQRLKGKDGKAGLFDRRAELILENKRLNQLHGAVLKALAEGATVEAVLEVLRPNDIGLLQCAETPEALRQLSAKLKAELQAPRSRPYSSLRFLMTRSMAMRLVARAARRLPVAATVVAGLAERWVHGTAATAGAVH